MSIKPKPAGLDLCANKYRFARGRFHKQSQLSLDKAPLIALIMKNIHQMGELW
jgi:hypothetical protein